MTQQQGNAGASAAPKIKRAYVRKGNANSSEYVFPTSPPQLSDLAFNIHGWALEDGMANRGVFETINAYKATMVKGGFEAKVSELKETNHQADVYRNDLTYTARECDESLPKRDSAVCRYLVVGYSLQEDDPIFASNKTFARYSENELVGESRPASHQLIRWNDCLTPMLVVTPVKENTGTSVRLFALIMPKSGLCQPVLIQHERIFYRWEFRASAGARSAQRNKNWNQLVVEKARLLTPPGFISSAMGDEEDEPERSIKRSRSGATIKQEKQESEEEYVLEPTDAGDLQGSQLVLNLNLNDLFKSHDESTALVDVETNMQKTMSIVKIELSELSRNVLDAIRLSKNNRTLQELALLLVKVDKPSPLALENLVSLWHYATPGSNFGLADAFGAADELSTLWPRLSPLITVEGLVRIKTAMDRLGYPVGPELMEELFSNALAYLRVNPYITDEELPFKLNEFVQLAFQLHQSHADSVAWSVNEVTTDAVYLITLLRELVEYNDWETKVRNPGLVQNGPATPSAFTGQVFEYHINFDVAQKAAELANTIEELHAIAKAKGCGSRDINLWLRRLRLFIKQA